MNIQEYIHVLLKHVRWNYYCKVFSYKYKKNITDFDCTLSILMDVLSKLGPGEAFWFVYVMHLKEHF